MTLAGAACLMPDSLAPEVVTGLQRVPEAPTSGIEWVRKRLEGHPPADIVVLYRSYDGRLLGSEMLVSPAPGARPVRVGPSYMDEVPTEAIESVEVIRGPKLAVPGIDGVVVITLKAAVTVESEVRRQITNQLYLKLRSATPDRK
jgi:hypothetical protein